MTHHHPHHTAAAAFQAKASSSLPHRRFAGVPPKELSCRLGIAVRAVAAIGGGYALASLCAAALSVALPLSRAEAALAGTLMSFVVYACAVMWVFAARTAWRACLGLLIAALPLGLMLLVYVDGRSAA